MLKLYNIWSRDRLTCNWFSVHLISFPFSQLTLLPPSSYFLIFSLAVAVIQCICSQAVVPSSKNKAKLDMSSAVSSSQGELLLLSVSCGWIPHWVDHLSWIGGDEGVPSQETDVSVSVRWPTSEKHSCSYFPSSWQPGFFIISSPVWPPVPLLVWFNWSLWKWWLVYCASGWGI